MIKMRAKSLFCIVLIFSILFVNNIEAKSVYKLKWISEAGAKTFPDKQQEYNVVDFGAIGDGITLNTKAIQDAIDRCASNGGGKVVFRPGKYLTGSIFLRNGVHLIIDEDVTILGSQNISDYPDTFTRVAGIEMVWPSALINIINCENAAVTGKGLINAQGKVFWELYWNMRKVYEPKGLRWIVDYDAKRPRTLLVSNSKNITVKDLRIQQSGFWTIQVLYSKYVTVNGVVIRNNIDGKGPSTDGIDIDSSEGILVDNCDIDCNDDDYCIKAGRDADGLRVNRPTQNVVIKNSISHRGGGVVTIGSETSGGIKNIYVANMKGIGTSAGVRLKSAKTRGGIVENIYIENLELDSVKSAINITVDWNPSYSYSKLPEGYNYDSIPVHWKTMLTKVTPPEKGLPLFRNVYIANIKGENIQEAIFADGSENILLKNFYLQNIKLNSKKPATIKNTENWNLKNVKINASEAKENVLENNKNLLWK